MAASGADGNAGENTPAHLVEAAVVAAAPAQIGLGLLVEGVGYQGRVGVLRHCPVVPGDGDFFLGFDTGLPALAQKGVAQIDRVFRMRLTVV